MEPCNAAQNGSVLFALAVTPLLEKIGEQGRNGLVNVRTLRVARQKDPVFRGQRTTGAQDLVLFHSQLGQFGRMCGDGVQIIAAAFQRSDLSVQRSQLL